MNFKFTTSGESHGKALVSIVEGVPAGLDLDAEAINHELWRRQQGYGRGARMKIESDRAEILSGVRHGKTLGSPIALHIENRDFIHWTEVMAAEKPTGETKNPRLVKRPRPGHADLPGGQKFATRDLRDILERASARETASRVACGAIARQLLSIFGVEIRSHVIKLGPVPSEPLALAWHEIASIPSGSLLNCADPKVEIEMIAAIDAAKEAGDTLGGVFETVARNVPVGLGSHTSWDEKLDGRLAKAFMSIQAVKAVEIGEGVANAGRFGSEVHDEIFFYNGKFVRRTNRAGGLEGGITNGEELRIRGYMKPIATLRKSLRSVDIDSKKEDAAAFERSDVTAVPAAGVIGEAMLAIVLANAMREKFGGDSIDEMRRNFDSFQASVEGY
jgi:chorismate synthase